MVDAQDLIALQLPVGERELLVATLVCDRVNGAFEVGQYDFAAVGGHALEFADGALAGGAYFYQLAMGAH